jgi:hypothetical protein
METTTITIASLSSVIALFIIRNLINTKGLRFNCSLKDVFYISGKVGQSTPSPTEEEHHHYTSKRPSRIDVP